MESIKKIQKLVKEGFEDWQSLGNIKALYWDNLVLLNYTHNAQYEGKWNEYERICRGLAINTETGKVVIRSFDKFFNWNERGFVTNSPIKHITEKVDGSLCNLFVHGKSYRFASRGSFDGKQAMWATRFFERRFSKYNMIDFNTLTNDHTLIFEAIYPENRIVVDYGNTEDLVLLAIRNKHSGEYLSYQQVDHIAYGYRFSRPKVHSFSNIEEILAAQKTLPYSKEGWVVEFEDGQRFKFKGDQYLEIHRIIAHMNFKNIVESVMENRYNQFIDGIPDEFLGQIKKWKELIDTYVRDLSVEIDTQFDIAPKTSRKEFALWIQKYRPHLSSYLFCKLDNKDYTPLIYKNLLKGTKDGKLQQSDVNGQSDS